MRSIKFRGKRVDTGEWVYGGISIFNGEATIFDENSVDNSAFDVDPKTVGQFTGKTLEKNHPMFYDREPLFEGDLFTTGSSDTIYQIVFDEGMFVGASKEGDMYGIFKCNLYAAGNNIMNKIGNIHDNPERRQI